MKKRNMDYFLENRIQQLEHLKGGYQTNKLHWWPWRPQKYKLHVVDHFNIEKC